MDKTYAANTIRTLETRENRINKYLKELASGGYECNLKISQRNALKELWVFRCSMLRLVHLKGFDGSSR